jgi:hypothetical protein
MAASVVITERRTGVAYRKTSPDRARRAVIGAVVVLATSTVLILASAGGWPGRDYRNQDFFQYYAGAAAVASGVSPYDTHWWTAFSAQQGSDALHNPPQPAAGDAAWTTPYPLYLFVTILPIAFLPFDLAAAAWLVAQIACVALGLAFVARQLLTGRPRDGLLLTALAVAFQPLWHLLVNGNLTGLVFGAFAGAVGMTLRGRPWTAGALLAICAVKPQSLVVAVLVLVLATPARNRLRLVGGSALIGLPMLAAAFALQPGWLAGWLEAAAALQRTQFSNATGWTIDRIAPGLPLAAAPIAVVAAVGILGAWMWRVRPAPDWAIAAAIPVSVFAAPHGWTYDQLYLLISAAVVVAAIAAAPRLRRALVLGALATTFVAIPAALYAQHVVRNGEEASALVPLLVFAVVLFAHRLTSSPQRPLAQGAATNYLDRAGRSETVGVADI